MPTDQIVTLLIAERDRLTRAIEALGAPVKRRGRPPKNPTAVANAAPVAPAVRKRKRRTAAQREALSKRMKAYWAKRRKAEKKG